RPAADGRAPRDRPRRRGRARARRGRAAPLRARREPGRRTGRGGAAAGRGRGRAGAREVSALAEAAHLARAGRYDEARRALEALGGATSDDVAVLDLLARVHAQQGDLTAADECWARVESLDPEHTGAREGRRRIRAVW